LDLVGSKVAEEKDRIIDALTPLVHTFAAQKAAADSAMKRSSTRAMKQLKLSADVMISLNLATATDLARSFQRFIEAKGFSTWICLDASAGNQFRTDIVSAASKSAVFLAFINEAWAKSKECQFEFNVALRKNLTKGRPEIIPVIVGQFDLDAYPAVDGMLCNTNALFLPNPDDSGDCFDKILHSINDHNVEPSGVQKDGDEKHVSAPNSPKSSAVTMASPLLSVSTLALSSQHRGSTMPSSTTVGSLQVAVVEPPKPVAKQPKPEALKWTVDQVCEYLDKSVGHAVFKDYEKHFRHSFVDGYMLFDVDDSDMEGALNIKNSIHRKRFKKRIAELYV